MFGQNPQMPDKFELEMEVTDPQKQRALREKIVGKMQKIKHLLRAGCSQEEFDRYGVLLYGYSSVLKVIERIK
ncbi:MAG: DUF5398 family protein [Chlamydiia bacterium]|nr:DUF5398 family protein [Chlamydiia bacterium]